jgi:hypothetical protein
MYINKNFWQMRAILFIYFYKNPLHASKSYFSGCKNAKIGPKKKNNNNNSGTCDNGFSVFKFLILKKLTRISQKKKTENVLKFTLDKHISQILCRKNVKKNVREKRKKKKGCYYGPTVQGT